MRKEPGLFEPMKREPENRSGRAGGDESVRFSSYQAFKVKVREFSGSWKPLEGSAQRHDPRYVCNCRSGPIMSVALSWRQDVKERLDTEREETGVTIQVRCQGCPDSG